MGLLTVQGAVLTCSFGMTPGQLAAVTSQAVCMINGMLSATIQDCQPIVNIAPFGMCTSPANPAVQAATAAALGVPTPAPCIPSTGPPWMCPPAGFTCGIPALTSDGKLLCLNGGLITVSYPGQTLVTG